MRNCFWHSYHEIKSGKEILDQKENEFISEKKSPDPEKISFQINLLDALKSA